MSVPIKQPHPLPKKNEIYVLSRKPNAIYLKYIKKLLKNYSEVLIHGLGASIPKCIRIALDAEKLYSDVTLSTKTYTLKSFYEIEEEVEQKDRSAILIHIKKIDS